LGGWMVYNNICSKWWSIIEFQDKDEGNLDQYSVNYTQIKLI